MLPLRSIQGRQSRSSIFFVLAMLAMVPACFAQGKPAAGEITVTTRTSEEAVINGHVFADSTCAAIEFPWLLLIKPPDHGVVCYRIEEFEVAQDSFTDQACVGRRVSGVNIFYLAHPGYTGPDSLRYDTVSSRGRNQTSVRLSVLPDTRAPSARIGTKRPPDESPTLSGSVPKCAAPVS
jgi:hypothetical protein